MFKNGGHTEQRFYVSLSGERLFGGGKISYLFGLEQTHKNGGLIQPFAKVSKQVN